MPKSFEKEFISFCENQVFELNINQITVIKKLEQYYKLILNHIFQNYFQKNYLKKDFIFMEMLEERQ